MPAYEDKIEDMFTRLDHLYTAETGNQNIRYELQVRALTDNIIETAAAATKGGKRNAAKKQVLNQHSVYDLLSKHRVQSTVDQLIQFVQSMETTVCELYFETTL